VPFELRARFNAHATQTPAGLQALWKNLNVYVRRSQNWVFGNCRLQDPNVLIEVQLSFDGGRSVFKPHSMTKSDQDWLCSNQVNDTTLWETGTNIFGIAADDKMFDRDNFSQNGWWKPYGAAAVSSGSISRIWLRLLGSYARIGFSVDSGWLSVDLSAYMAP